MGGRAWNLPRMPRAEYLRVEEAVRTYLDAKVPGEYRIPRYFGDKQDFGDLDVLVALRPLDQDLSFLTQLCEDLGITQSRPGITMYTTVFRGLQTDFFPTDPEELESAYSYMCFGEVGNILGRLSRQFKLKFGSDGLTYIFRHGDNYKFAIPLTKDFSEVCALFELDYAAWEKGFETRREMFEWVTATPWFSPKPYLDPHGPIAERATTRPGVAAFVEYVKAELPDRKERSVENPLVWVEEKFPEARLSEKIEEQRLEVAQRDYVAARFNGKLVKSLRPELEKKELGEFIRLFKARHASFYAYLEGCSEDKLREEILAFQPEVTGA